VERVPVAIDADMTMMTKDKSTAVIYKKEQPVFPPRFWFSILTFSLHTSHTCYFILSRRGIFMVGHQTSSTGPVFMGLQYIQGGFSILFLLLRFLGQNLRRPWPVAIRPGM
jgi:hypothetical protein